MKKLSKTIVSIVLCLTLILTSLPLSAMALNAYANDIDPGTVTDPGTAYTWETMMGTDTDGNRYAGRVWADKSVYKEGDIAVLNTSGNDGSTFQVTLDEDELFQIVFSALGSSMSSTDTKVSAGPMDVVLILDNSTSMQDVSNGTTRLQKVIESANGLLENLLTSSDIRIGITSYNYDADTVLPFGKYTNGITLSVNNYATGGKISAHDDSRKLLGSDNGYNSGTNTQSGYDLAMKMLEGASDTEGRSPVVILLTDGAANTGVDKSFYDISKGTIRQRFYDNGVPVGIALSTLLNAAYMKASVGDNYNGTAPVVYGIGVDLETGDGSDAIINPGASDGFSSTNSNQNIREAYRLYTEEWSQGKTVTVRHSSYSFTFDHKYPKGSQVTDQDVMDNINYVDHYYNVTSEKLEDTFKQIYEEISSGAFNPITSTQKVDSATGVKDTPLIYVDFIGQHMEVKEIQAVTLFGSSFGVTKGTAYADTIDGDAVNVTPYTVAAGTGTNPTTNESWSTSDHIKIEVIEYEDGTQKLEVRISQEILPIILEQLTSKTVGNKTVTTIDEFSYNPLRVYYTVGIDSDILLPNGKIDVSKIQGYEYINDLSGTVSFFSNQFGVMNPADGEAVNIGDAHIGFQPSTLNRYYYHQSNQGIFTKVETTDNSTIQWDASEYGVLWQDGKYDLTWMSYDEYKSAKDDDEVYTYVTYYHPTPSATDADNAAEEVTYLVYTDWKYLKDSVSFFDNTTGKYVNYNSETDTFTLDSVGYVVSSEKIAEYAASNPSAELYAVLGVGSLRTSRLHNMMVEKEDNTTATAQQRYTPEYTSETSKKTHNGNSVVVWLGNNGMHTVEIDTGIALTKNITEAFGNADATYALTVTVPAGVEADPVVVDAHGHDVTASIAKYENNVLTVNVKAGETVYVSGIPGGTECTIGEIIDGDYYIESATDKVTVPKVSDVLSGDAQFAAAYVTNAPYKYGNLTIIKDIFHNYDEIPESMEAKEFTFKVQLPASLANKTYAVDKTNAPEMTESSITTDDTASFEVTLKDNESITILNLPEGTDYTVTEISTVPGYENTTGEITGVIAPNTDSTAHFVNTYKITPIKPDVTISGNKILVDNAGTYTENEDFTFVLSEYVGVSDTHPTGYNVLATATAKAGESYSFNLSNVLTEAHGIGTYYYRVTEQAGNTAGMVYDSTRGLFAVVITDNDADGTLEYTVNDFANTTVNGNTVAKDFTNIYNVSRTHADVNIIKELKNTTGVDLPKDLFHFVLVNANDASEVYNATTDASGNANIRIADLAEGTYTYTLSEVDGGMAGMSYDKNVYTVVIIVTNNEGVLNAVVELEGAAEVNGDDSIDVTFVNEYKLDPTTHTISGEKKLEGRNVESGEFIFELYETDSSFVLNGSAKETVKNTGNTFSFSEITFDKVGTYYYSVKEKAGNAAGVTYDTTHYHVTVTVEVDPVDATKLAVTNVSVNKIGHNSDETGSIVFVNTYVAAPTSYTISGTKTLIGRAINAGEFKFALYENDEFIEEVAVRADGTFTFSPITYRTTGEFVYTVKETQGATPGVIYTGVDNPITVKVTVTDNEGILTARADVANTDIHFVNEYVAASTSIIFDGVKNLVGATLNDGDFTFDLYETDHTFTVSGEPVDSVKNENSKFEFKEIEFDKTGTYFFVIEENRNDPIDGIVYDHTQHRLLVQIRDIGHGKLIPTVVNLDESESFTIHNAYDTTLYVGVHFTNATFEESVEKEVFVKDNVTTEIDGAKVEEGAILTYAITYSNYTGDNVVVDIRDTIPAHTSYVEGSASHNGTYVGTQLLWTINVGKGETVTVTFDVKVDESNVIFNNEAHIRDGYNTYTTNKVVNHTVGTEDQVEKDVFKAENATVSIDGKKVYADDILLYTVTYKNTSADSVAVTITDAIPEHTTYVEGTASNGGVYAAGTLTWEIPEVSAWSSVTVSFEVKVERTADAVTIPNKAQAESNGNFYTTNEVKNYTVDDDVVKSVYAKDTAASIDGKKVYKGDILVYEISYTNTALEAATVEIIDTIPAGTKYVDGTASNDGAYAEGKIKWNINVDAGDTVTVAFEVEVLAAGASDITNAATVIEGNNSYTTNEVYNYTVDDEVEKKVYSADDTAISIDGEKVYAGDILVYEIFYGNTSSETATVEIVDLIPENTKYVAGSADNGGVYTDGKITWTLDVDAGESISVTFAVEVEDAGVATIKNAATVTEGKNTYTTNEVTNYTVVDEVKKDVFAKDDATVSIDGKKVYAGDILTYAVLYKNTSGEKVTVTITDEIPEFTTYVDGTASHNGVYDDGKIIWTLDVDAGESVTVTFDVKVDKVGAVTIENAATVEEGKNTYTTNEVYNYTVEDEVEKNVSLAGKPTVSLDGLKVYAGDVLNYTISYKNTSLEAATVEIIDIIPEYTKYVEGTADNGGVYADGKITWTIDVEAGRTIEVSFSVEVMDVGAASIKNAATIVEGRNSYTTNEVYNYTVEDEVEKNVSLAGKPTVSLDGLKVYAGDVLNYTISYKNTSLEAATVEIIDIIPEYTKYVEGSADNGGVYADGKITWTIDVEAGRTIEVSFSVEVMDVGAASIKNAATIVEGKNTYTTNEVTTYTVSDEVSKDVYALDNVGVSIDKEKVALGDILVYAITYKNTSAEKATVTITDAIPQYTKYVEGTADNDGVYADGKITWTVEADAGETVTVSFRVEVTATDAVTIKNEATVVEGKNVYTTNEVTNETEKAPDQSPEDNEDNEQNEQKPDPKPEAGKPTSPVTGDRNVAYLVMLLLISCGGFAATAAYGKKKKEEN